ncbi:MAG: DUF2332 domain-containing protein [Actinomycetota bacterium]
MTTGAQTELAEQLNQQAEWCERLGSKLYATLLGESAQDAQSGGPVWSALGDHLPAPLLEVMLPLRFMAAMHSLVLRDRAPELARFYPSAGGDGKFIEAWPAFVSALEENIDEVHTLSGFPVQTNEVGRCAALVGGFLRISHDTGKPLRLLEVGSSAGLNLRWDRYRYVSPTGSWGPSNSAVHMRWDAPPAHLDARLEIADRRGCDPSPLNPLNENDRTRLLSAVWPDQVERVERTRGAFAEAPSVPVEIDQGSAMAWLPRLLEEPSEGVATVIFHSIVLQYLSDQERADFLQLIDEAGESATDRAPLAHLTLEPDPGMSGFPVRLRMWPNGKATVLAQSGPHGGDIVWT